MRAVRSHDHRVDVVDLPDPTAPADGVVQELLYAPGDQVAEGAELLKLAAA